MKAFKMTCELYEDVKIVNDAILYLHGMIETLEKECMIRDEGKAEMDYCFTKMMNGEKVSSTWSEEDEEYNGEDYGIDSLYHAQRILEKTLGEVDGYQTDDGILSHKCAITAVKKLYEQKPAEWSEAEL